MAKMYTHRKASENAPIRVQSDDFSLKATSDVDPMFWVRIETPVGASARITDAQPGTLPEMMVAAAIDALLVNVGVDPEQLEFTNVLPGELDADLVAARIEMETRVSRVHRWGEWLGQRRADGPPRFELRRENDKLDVIVIF